MSNFHDYSVARFGEYTQYIVGVVGLEQAKQVAMWGTYGKGGIEHCNGACDEHPLRYKRLIDCDDEHLQAILKTQSVQNSYAVIIGSILADRGLNVP